MNSLKNMISDFMEESLELIDHIMSDILELESNPEMETINRIYRGFHSIKGDAHLLGFENVFASAGLGEDQLSLMRSKAVKINKEEIDKLLYRLDEMREKVVLIQSSDTVFSDNLEMIAPTPHKMTHMKDAAAAGQRPTHRSAVSNRYPENADSGIYAYDPATMLRILIVEDDFTSRTLLMNFLSKFGDCHVAKDGLEAIGAFVTAHDATPPAPYDLICMDLLMPNMDGSRSCKTIREIERGKGIEGTEAESTIIVVTALSDPSTYVKTCYECGADAYLVKPIDLNQLQRHVFGLKKILVF